MTSRAAPLRFDRDFDPQTGTPVPIAPEIVRVTARNRGPYTFTGTNTFLLGTDRLTILDPGPDSKAHFAALIAAIGGRRVSAILLTHTHRDHCGLARRLAAATEAPIWCGGRHRLSRPRRLWEINPVSRESDWGLVPDRVLGDGEDITAGDMLLRVVATPGHCANHLAFAVADTPLIFTGDHVMGWNSTLVAVPDGSMRAYLASLARLIEHAAETYLPAHGGPIRNGRDYARALLAHRQARNDQILGELARVPQTLERLRRAIYPELAPSLWMAARMTLEAHVEFLEESGALTVRRGPLGMRIAYGTP